MAPSAFLTRIPIVMIETLWCCLLFWQEFWIINLKIIHFSSQISGQKIWCYQFMAKFMLNSGQKFRSEFRNEFWHELVTSAFLNRNLTTKVNNLQVFKFVNFSLAKITHCGRLKPDFAALPQQQKVS